MESGRRLLPAEQDPVFRPGKIQMHGLSREAEIVAALEKHGGDRLAAAQEVSVHMSKAQKYALRDGIAPAKRRSRAESAFAAGIASAARSRS
jgi:hypothetical protein